MDREEERAEVVERERSWEAALDITVLSSVRSGRPVKPKRLDLIWCSWEGLMEVGVAGSLLVC